MTDRTQDVLSRAVQWVMSDDTGASSCCIWSVMMGYLPTRSDTPWDPADFGRCYRLFKLIPEWRSRLDEMKQLATWASYVNAWPKLEAMYEQIGKTTNADAMYQVMEDIRRGRSLDTRTFA